MKICERPGCERKHKAKGLCSTHYNNLRKQLFRKPKRRSEPEETYPGNGKPISPKENSPEIRALVLAILKQAMEDVVQVHGVRTFNDYTMLQESARSFLFDDNVILEAFGGLTPRDLLESVEIDLDYIRDGLRRRVPGCHLPKEPRRAETGDRLCETPGCSNPHSARGMCSTHYTSWRKQKLKSLQVS